MTSEPSETRELREAFCYNDLDKDGRIEFGEFVEEFLDWWRGR